MTQSAHITITEGTTTISVFSKKNHPRGPGKKQSLPFYNPAMELNRDLSIAFLQWYVNKAESKQQISVLDGLAASGIRGIRMANEIDDPLCITCNDWSNDAYTLIQKNITENKLNTVTATQKNIHTLLAQHRYHYVDIDPFGTPAPYLDSAIRGLEKNGILACTATDTATLCGHYPAVCRRRYAAKSLLSPMMHEIGLRILIAFIIREAAKYDLAMTPRLCYATDHYMRLYLQMNKGVSLANKCIKEIKTIPASFPFLKSKTKKQIGPLYMGIIQDASLIKPVRSIVLQRPLGSKHELLGLLNLLEEEAEGPPFFYTINTIASALNTSAPSRKALFHRLQDNGYFVSRTHLDPTGFKTDASEEDIITAFHQAKKQ